MRGDVMFKEYLKQHEISIYWLSKNTEISYSTLNDFVNGKVDIENCKFGMIKKIADTLNLSLEKMYQLCRNKKIIYSEQYDVSGEIKVIQKSYHIVFDDQNICINKRICPINAINDVFIDIVALWMLEDYFLEKELNKAYDLYIDEKKHTDNSY